MSSSSFFCEVQPSSSRPSDSQEYYWPGSDNELSECDFDPLLPVLGDKSNEHTAKDIMPQPLAETESESNDCQPVKEHIAKYTEQMNSVSLAEEPATSVQKSLSLNAQQAQRRQTGYLQSSKAQAPIPPRLPPQTHDLVEALKYYIEATMRSIESWPEKLDQGAVAFSREFNPDTRQAAVNIASHFRNRGRTLFIMDNTILTRWSPLLPLHLPTLWHPLRRYPSRASFENGDETGKHNRGVYMIRLVRKERLLSATPPNAEPFDQYSQPTPASTQLPPVTDAINGAAQSSPAEYLYTVFHSVGSGRSARGGMLMRAVQAADPAYRRAHPSELHKELDNPNTTFRIYILAEWKALKTNPAEDRSHDEILITEGLCQTRFRTGCLFGRTNQREKMTGFFKHLQVESDGDDWARLHSNGLNVQSALEPLRYTTNSTNN